jgi:hypothetical protein
MADITVKAAYGSVVEDEGTLYIGFAEGEAEDEAYVLFRREGDGPLWFETSDESFGAEEAVASVTGGPAGFEVRLRPETLATFGFASTVEVRVGPTCEDGAEALAALREMLGPLWQDEG